MPRTLQPWNKKSKAPSFYDLFQPAQNILTSIPPLEAQGNRPLQMEFEDQLKALVLYHLDEHTSGSHLLQVLEEDSFAREQIAPPGGIKKSSFFEALNSRGLEQLNSLFQKLQSVATKTLPAEYSALGDLIAIDGSLINATLSMYWADYRGGSKKAKAHLGFDLNRSIPRKIFLTNGKAGERAFVSHMLAVGETGVMDRGYQSHKAFDHLQADGKHFVCRIKASTQKTCIKNNPVKSGSIVFYDAIVLLGTAGVNQTEKELRVVGYRVDGIEYWAATSRYDLSAEQIALIYKLRWDIEKFFGWWKRHLKVYHLIARSQYGLMVQILAGLITYLLLAIYCHKHYREKVSIKRVRELRIRIQNEVRNVENDLSGPLAFKNQKDLYAYAKT
jgi:hypothetical protein